MSIHQHHDHHIVVTGTQKIFDGKIKSGRKEGSGRERGIGRRDRRNLHGKGNYRQGVIILIGWSKRSLTEIS